MDFKHNLVALPENNLIAKEQWVNYIQVIVKAHLVKKFLKSQEWNVMVT